MITAVTHGRDGTAMRGFSHTLSTVDIAAVVDFVRQEFMTKKALNTRYHTAENGWPDHERYAVAFPFALGKIAIDTPTESLSPEQQLGKRIYLASCVTCHDRAKVSDTDVVWEPRPVSYPRNQYTAGKSATAGVDATSQASIYAKHQNAPQLANLTAREQRGEKLFQANCAFCHAADGTGKNWIGQFLESHPRNLTDTAFMQTMTYAKLKHVIENGLPGTTMSAWKNVLQPEEIDSIIGYINKAFYPVAADN